MNIYFVQRTDGWDGYYEFIDFVISCETEDEARNTHPRKDRWEGRSKWDGDEWVTSPDNVSVTHLGTAKDGISGIIVARYCAG